MENQVSGNRDNESNSRKIVIATEDDLPAYVRPLCVLCGIPCKSKGDEWQCPICKKRFCKIKNTRESIIGPPCQYCGGETRSRGIFNWRCRICGKYMQKER